MNKKKIQAQMQLDVSFVGNTTQLVKQLDALPGKLHLNTAVTKQLGEGFAKSYKSTISNLSKLAEGLSKPGLSAKQYTTFFDNINLKIQDTSKQMFTLKKGLQDAYKSPVNKQMLKDLEAYKKKLEEVNQILSNQKAAQTRQNTAKNKLKDELGLDYDVAGGMLGAIAARKRNKQDITKTQSNWLERQGLDEKQLARALELLRQIEVQQHKISGGDSRAQQLTGKKTASAGQSFLTGEIGRLEANSYSHDELKSDMSAISKFTPEINEAADALNNKLGPAFESSLTAGQLNAEKMAEGMSTLNEVLSQFGIVLSAGTIVRAFKDMAVAAFEFYKSLDSALNEIYIVSNLSSNAVNDLKTNFINMAKDTGMALDDITRSATLFYQQGLSTDEVMEMTRVTSEFAKVAGIDATDAADKLTAAVNGYCLAAEDASIVADKFNKVAAASAADIDELSTAFSKAAAQANQAGVGMDNYLAYIATMVEATREAPENIGTSLKTIMSRMQQVKEAGTTDDGETDVNQVETALKSVGVALRDANGELRDLEEVFDDLGPKWNSLDRNTQAYLGTIIAGTRQQSRFITLMQNWDRVLELSEDSANSAGQQALMHAKAMESIESKMQQMQVAWQEFISNIANSDIFKTLIEGITGFINVINSGSTPVVLLGTALGLLVKQATKLSSPIGRLFTKMGEGIGKIRNLNKENLKLAAGFFSSQKKVNGLTANIAKHQKSITDLQKKNKTLVKTQKEFQSASGLTHDQLMKTSQAYQDLEKEVQENNAAMTKHGQQIAYAKGQIIQLTPELQKQSEAYDGVQSGLTSLSVGLAAMSTILPGLAGDMAGAASGIVMIGSAGAQVASTIVSSVIPIMQTMKVSFIGAIKSMDAAMAASVIGAIIQAIVLAIMGAITAVKALVEAFGNQDKKIAESVNKVGDSLQNYSNALNKVKGAEKLLQDYEKLSNKIYRTAKEQEQLNTLAQELGDSLEIETIEDEYGNLSIAIDDAKQKISEMKEESKKARKELIDAEHEAIEQYDHNGNVDNFYEEYLKAYKSDIRGVMDEIDTGLDTDELATSSKNVQNIMNELKDNVIENSAEMSEAFGGLGVEWSLTEDVESMIDAFNDANIDSSKWNDLYRTFDVLQDKIDSISYDDALNVVEGSIKAWGEAAGLTKEQLDLMADSIMNTLYGSSNLHNTMSGYQDIIDRDSGETQANTIEGYKKQLEELEKESTTFWNPFKQDDAEKEYEAVQKKIELLEEEQLAYENVALLTEQINQGMTVGYDIYGNTVDLQTERNRLMEEYNISSAEEVENAKKMKEILGQFSDNSAAMFDSVGLFDEDAKGLLEELNDSGKLSEILTGFKMDDQTGTKELTDALVEIINTTDDSELREAAEDKLEAVFKNIEVRGTMSWSDLSGELDSISEDLRKMNNVMEEFNEAGGFSLETFGDLCDVLDSMDLSAIFDTGKMDQYIAALDQLQLGFDASTGVITANGEALRSLQDIQQAATQAKLAQTAQSLEADKAALQAQIYGIEAEIAANNLLIDYLAKQGEARVDIDDIAKQGQIDYNNTMQQAATQTAGLYQDMTSQSSAWATAAITNAASVGEAIKKAMTGDLGTANLGAYLNNLVSEMDYKSTGSYVQLEAIKDKDGKVKATDAIAALQAYNVKGQNTIDELYSQMKAIDSMKGLLTTMSEADLSKLGTSGSGDKKEVEKYIGQLKEIYNILNRIQTLEHRLSTLDSYAEIAEGEQYGNLLKERLSYNEELMDQYEFLVSEQKQFTNGYKDFIGSVEGLEGVFEFDKFGQIIINWDKYNALQDEAIDGETTLKEKADDVYDTYTTMFEDLQGYFDELIAYYQTVIELQEEMVDAYIEMQNDAAAAVQEIYQKILDTKLEAIDAEKEALEELRQAREDARKDQKNAEDISNLQTNIQRTMMDSSGASDISFIKAQNDMNDKLEEIADDKYSEMLDNIIERLEQEQDALQENFDELFENQQWLFEWLDEEVMRDSERLTELLQQTDEWNQTSMIEQQRLMSEWQTKFHTYNQAVTENPKGIYGIFDNITETKKRIGDLDTHLQSSISKGSADIAQTIANWQKSNSSSSGSGGSGGSGGGGGGGKKTYSTANDYKATITGKDDSLGDTSKKPIAVSAYAVGDTLSTKETGWLDFVTQYDWKDGKMKSDLGVLGARAQNKVVTDIQYYNGQFYYLLKGLDGYIKGAQLDRKKQGSGKPLEVYKAGGLNTYTGPAWLDGTPEKPEAVLNALQTEHFIKFTNALDNMFSSGNVANTSSTVSIDTISFNVESMSSPEDGEAAFNMFVNKFKEIGSQSGIKIDSFKSRL